MNGTWPSLHRIGMAALGGVLLAALANGSGALAADVGVTLKTTMSDSYRGTVPLTPGTAKLLVGGAEDSDNKDKIAAQLAKLKDGDILVLAMHSNTKVFALGEKTYSWESFWATFGIARPPRLAAAILGGCMFDHVGTADIPIKPTRVRELRASLNAEIIYTPKGAIQPHIGSHNSFLILQSMLQNNLLKDIDLGGGWYRNVSSRWIIKGRWSGAKLDFLRRVNTASRAYEAGVDARLANQKVDEAGKDFANDPQLIQAFRLGYDHANEVPDNVRKEEEKLRRQIMGEE